ncbi:MAG: efflux RND transporter periplasmic adaptor subunit [Parvibaculaceae bacterium]|nr:efflux RND transporter periplasmic adaptor subunit [Parvibaculaceae bacterium]
MRVVSAAVAVIISFLLLAGCSDRKKEDVKKPEAAIPVETALVAEAPWASDIEAAGTVKLKSEQTLSFKVSGLITHFYVDDGDAVARGQKLASLDLTEVNAQKSDAEARVVEAQRAFDRAEALQEKGFGTVAVTDAARRALMTARTSRDQINFNSGWAQIFAPTDGIVLHRFAEPNELMNAGEPVLTVGDRTEGLIMRVPLSDQQVVRLRMGDRAVAHFRALSGEDVVGKVTRIGAQADPQTGAFDVELTFASPPPSLMSGMIGSASITPSVMPAVKLLEIPATALVEATGDGGYVYRIDPATSRAVHTTIRVGGIRGEAVLVRSGLAAGDRVVAAGAAYLSDGDLVSSAAPTLSAR